MTQEFSLPKAVREGLIMRAVHTDEEAQRVAAINRELHGADAGDIVRHWLFHGHPFISRGDWLFIEDQATGDMAATLCLIPMTWRYGLHALPVAELGFVGTAPAYRGQGLQRVLSDAFDQLALSRGYTLAAIEGIPGFYGQFGYEYAVPLLGGCDLSYQQIPGETSSHIIAGRDPHHGYSTRAAAPEDVSALQRLYDSSVTPLDIAAPRDHVLWMHQLSVPKNITFYASTTVIERDGRVEGYLRWTDDDWTDRLRILELAVGNGPGARERILVAMRFALEMGSAAGKRGVTLQLPANHPAILLGRYLGAGQPGYYGWQMKVLNPIGFLSAITAALEDRLDASLMAGCSGTLTFLLYGHRSPLVLHLLDGCLVEIDLPEREIEPDARMTLKQASQLWLGWQGRAALEEWYPDFNTSEPSRQLIDALFPKAQAYIYIPY